MNNRSGFQAQSIAHFGGSGFTTGDAFKWHSPGAHSSLPVTEIRGEGGKRALKPGGLTKYGRTLRRREVQLKRMMYVIEKI